mmetsp:Transcript_29188/g.89279  ORF Transcript_29188/g.89279 Transcript_29188/m.89279 type:complete len:341 (+) Transcript_29188:61-1083(+)|eukprot:CAMPEP_0198654820 /NCGR_PEP_ID=MMETSP1467-20131203/7962_1 /TAXON_ID=1462469 /ORGANISM="unid. sp., Strain CCMP2135" /LENGTH=340 /DNA_ID=CAMNT_0044390819 /DNA_START=55 /DNA_END=1077 /DNA_ORIENTATION=+
MASMKSQRAWGDEDDEDDVLPAREETEVNAQGVKKVTEYRLNAAGQKVRVVREIKVTEVVRRVPRAIAARKQRLRKFGAAKDSQDETNVTIVSSQEERVTLDDENAPGGAEASAQGNVKEAMNEFARKQMWRKLQQKYGVDDAATSAPPEDDIDDTTELGRARLAARAEAEASGKGEGENLAKSADVRSAYVPPSLRGQVGASGGGSGLQRLAQFDDRDHATLRVSNISEETKEEDLQQLFQPYGNIARIYLAKDRETLVSRGFAFVSFVRRDDAGRAMQALQGHGYDHLILRIEWAKPSTREPASDGGLSSGYTSGYGKALAQDTKERVSYASNLTANR